MRRIAVFAFVIGALGSIAVVAPAQAQATRTWVSGVGDDVNPCSRTAPCKTFAGAISKTAVNGEISCLDPGGFGAVTITKSITIDCRKTGGGILASSVNGVIVNITSGTDSLKTVRLRGLDINGTGGGARSGIRGISILSASVVFVEETVISDFTQQGINNGSTIASKLYVRDSVIRNNAGSGISSAGTATTIAVIENTSLTNNAFGVASASSNNVVVKRSVLSGNSTAGVQADTSSQITVDGSVISNNTTGVAGTGTIRLSDNDIAFNSTGIANATTSFGTNRISGNGAAGTAPTPTPQQ